MGYRPRSVKRRRVGRKRLRFSRARFSGGNVKKGIYHFSRWVTAGSTGGNLAFIPYTPSGFAPTFNNLVNFTEFTTLFDQYRINSVVFKLTMTVDPGAQAAANAVIPRLFYMIDNDDAAVVSGLDEFRQHSKCKIVNMLPGKTISIKFKPAVLGLIFNGVTSAYAPKWKQWLDCLQADVPHYGIRWAIDNFTNTNYVLRTEAKVYFSMRHLR